MCDRIGFKSNYCDDNYDVKSDEHKNTNFSICCKIEKLKNFYNEVREMESKHELIGKIIQEQKNDVNNEGLWIKSSTPGKSCKEVCEGESYHLEDGTIGKMSCKDNESVSSNRLTDNVKNHINQLDSATGNYDNVNFGIYKTSGNEEYKINGPGNLINCNASSMPENGVVTNICPCYRSELSSQYTPNDLINLQEKINSKREEIKELEKIIDGENASHKLDLLNYMGENFDSDATFGLEGESLFDANSEGVSYRLVDWIKRHVGEDGIFTKARNTVKNAIIEHDSSKALHEKTERQLTQSNTEIIIWGAFSVGFIFLLRNLVKKTILKKD